MVVSHRRADKQVSGQYTPYTNCHPSKFKPCLPQLKDHPDEWEIDEASDGFPPDNI